MNKPVPIRQDAGGATPIGRKSSRHVEEFLQQRVLGGDWPAGHKLPSEAELGKQFNASRTVIREAIRRLQGRGLLKTVNGSGTYVSGGRLEDLSMAFNAYSVLASAQKPFSDLLELRMAIEGDAAAKVAAGHKSLDWRRLESRLEMMSACRLLEEFAIHDIDFHMDILHLSGNELFASLGAALRDRYVRFAIDRFSMEPSRNADYLRGETMVEHRMIVDAISRGDVDFARQSARRHVTQSRVRWELAQTGDSTAAESGGKPPAFRSEALSTTGPDQTTS